MGLAYSIVLVHKMSRISGLSLHHWKWILTACLLSVDCTGNKTPNFAEKGAVELFGQEGYWQCVGTYMHYPKTTVLSKTN